jgi:PAS domain S-box-containing protein
LYPTLHCCSNDPSGKDIRRVADFEVTRAMIGRGPEKRQTERRLATDEQFRLLVSTVRDYAIFLLDNDGRVVSWNPGAERIKGYTAEEILGESFTRFYQPADIAAGVPIAALRQAAETGRYAGHGWRVRKDGTRFYAHVVIAALRDASGNMRGFAKVTQDVTEQQQQREELAASVERFRTTVEHLLDPLTILSAIRDSAGQVVDFRYEYVNAAHGEQALLSAESLVGHRLLELHPEVEANGLFDAYRKVVETGERLIWDAFLYQDTSGDRPIQRVLDVRAAKLDDGVLITWRNVTDRLRTERELADARVEAELHQRLQASLLPEVSVRDPRVQVLAYYQPGGQRELLGADFYDCLELDDGSIAMLVGDVAGHGPDEAGVGVALRVAWRAMVLTEHDPPDLLVGLDRVLTSERRSDELFATVTCLWVSPDRRRATIALAGHPPPLLVRGDEVGVVAVPYGRVLGIGEPDVPWESSVVALDERWLLLCYTDGLIEGRCAPGAAERYGIERLAETVRTLNRERPAIGELVDRLVAAVQSANGGQLSDDVAVICIATLDGRAGPDSS